MAGGSLSSNLLRVVLFLLVFGLLAKFITYAALVLAFVTTVKILKFMLK